MKRFASKIIWLIVILIMAVWVAPFVVDAATYGITPKNAVDLEVGIGGFKKVEKGIAEYIGQVYLFATAIVGGLAVVMIIIGAVQYSSSAGNKAAIGSAKETMTSAIIGLVIVLMAYLILGTISGDFVNLTNPRLNVINISNTTSINPSTYYCALDPLIPGQHICQRDASGRTPSDSGCTKDTMGLQCAPDRPPKDVTCSELEATEEACEKGSDYWCKLCVRPNGEKLCIDKKDRCGGECSENCMLEAEYESCLTKKHACEINCSPFPYRLTNAMGCSCGSAIMTRDECELYCGRGNATFNSDKTGSGFDKGTCHCTNNKTENVKISLEKCKKYQEQWSNKCVNEYNCGPGGPHKTGRDAYCCTDKSAPTP